MPEESITVRVAKEADRIVQLRAEALFEIFPMPPGMEMMKDKEAARRRYRQVSESGNPQLIKDTIAALGGPMAVLELMREPEERENG